MDISVIIVSYNTAQLTLDCLKSLRLTQTNKEIFVVDNASTDGSVEAIRTHFPEVLVIANPTNCGFGAANNQALKLSHGRYVVFLNPDTTVKSGSLTSAVSFMDSHPAIGLAGAKILNPDGSLQESISYRYPGEKFTSDEASNLKGDIACVLGAFMIARKSLLDELAGFDEDFFLYGEDQDLAWRIREKGYAIGYIEKAEVFHWGGKSEIATAPPALFRKKLQAEFLFYQKHYSPSTLKRIKAAQNRKALFRLVTLKIQMPLSQNKVKIKNKMECYRIVLETFRD